MSQYSVTGNVCGSRLDYLCNGLKNNHTANLVLFFNHVKTVFRFQQWALLEYGLCLLTSTGLFLLASSFQKLVAGGVLSCSMHAHTIPVAFS